MNQKNDKLTSQMVRNGIKILKEKGIPLDHFKYALHLDGRVFWCRSWEECQKIAYDYMIQKDLFSS